MHVVYLSLNEDTGLPLVSMEVLVLFNKSKFGGRRKKKKRIRQEQSLRSTVTRNARTRNALSSKT